MVQDSSGLHHFHRRIRIHQKHEPYPHPDKWKRFMDKAIYVVSIFGPIMTIPQVKIIWIDKNASSISVISWIAYLIAAIFWLIYGIMHREKPIIFLNIIWIFLQLSIIVGTLIYG